MPLSARIGSGASPRIDAFPGDRLAVLRWAQPSQYDELPDSVMISRVLSSMPPFLDPPRNGNCCLQVICMGVDVTFQDGDDMTKERKICAKQMGDLLQALWRGVVSRMQREGATCRDCKTPICRLLSSSTVIDRNSGEEG